MQFCGSQAPSCPQPGLFSTVGFPQSLICTGTGLLCLLTCLLAVPRQPRLSGPPPAGTQSRAWHGVGALQTSVRGMTIDGGTNECTVPPHVPSPPSAATHLAGAGCPRLNGVCVLALALGGGKGRADPPPLVAWLGQTW